MKISIFFYCTSFSNYIVINFINESRNQRWWWNIWKVWRAWRQNVFDELQQIHFSYWWFYICYFIMAFPLAIVPPENGYITVFPSGKWICNRFCTESWLYSAVSHFYSQITITKDLLYIIFSLLFHYGHFYGRPLVLIICNIWEHWSLIIKGNKYLAPLRI